VCGSKGAVRFVGVGDAIDFLVNWIEAGLGMGGGNEPSREPGSGREQGRE
jgi:hypothetical protein